MSKTISPLEQTLIDTIQKSSNVMGEMYDGAKSLSLQAIDTAKEQIPDVIHQLLMFNLANAIIWIVIGAIIIIAYTAGWFKLYDFSKKAREFDAIVIYSVIGGTVAIIGGGAILITNLLIALKITLAPKIYLLEYVANLLK